MSEDATIFLLVARHIVLFMLVRSCLVSGVVCVHDFFSSPDPQAQQPLCVVALPDLQFKHWAGGRSLKRVRSRVLN